jgi:hypothetical protein
MEEGSNPLVIVLLVVGVLLVLVILQATLGVVLEVWLWLFRSTRSLWWRWKIQRGPGGIRT